MSDLKLNKSQERAVKFFRRHLESNIAREPAHYGTAITKFEVSRTDYGAVWITATVDHTALPENNLLRFVSHQHWHVAVGPRGGLQVWSCPKAYEQFRGGRAFGMEFHKIK